MLFTEHKTHQTIENRFNFPHRVPRFWVIVTDRQANALSLHKSSTRSDHEHTRRLHGILFGELQHAMIVPTFICTTFKAVDTEVPVENVVWVRFSNKIVVCL
jgi:hypothetical protein